MLCRNLWLGLLGGTLLWGTPAFAHHPDAGLFDHEHAVTLTGIVRSILYAEPHVTLQFESGADHQMYTLVLPSPFSLETHGMPKGTLREGMTLALVADPGVNDASVLLPEHIEAGGVTYEMEYEVTPGAKAVRAR